jgi:hypothetical protein
MRKLSVVATLATIVCLWGAGPASAGSTVPTKMTVVPDSTTIDGAPVDIHVQVQDANGNPVGGALLRLTVSVEFMGKPHNMIAGEATTNAAGRAVISFAPAQTGSVQATVSFWGSHGYGPSDAAATLDVQRAVVTYTKDPVGLQAWWAHADLIFVPFAVIWGICVLVLIMALRIRRAGAPLATLDLAPSDRAVSDRRRASWTAEET